MTLDQLKKVDHIYLMRMYLFNFTSINSKATHRGILFSDLPQSCGCNSAERALQQCIASVNGHLNLVGSD